ncbi:MAG: tripartite tricarboxylate transporter permease, partial [Actinobacteria bacterium]|nr:tripartite tricarboxylate transporter permease [Actinomycetota bacterium]
AAEFAVRLGPVDYVALMVLAFITVGALLGSSISRGLTALSLGLFVGLVGVDEISGQQRYALGLPVLSDGIDVVLVAVALFAVGEALYVGSRLRHGPPELIAHDGPEHLLAIGGAPNRGQADEDARRAADALQRAERETLEVAVAAGLGDEHPLLTLLGQQADVELRRAVGADVTQLGQLTVGQRRAVLGLDVDGHLTDPPICRSEPHQSTGSPPTTQLCSLRRR